jgi:hypothetical protein
LVDIEGLTYQGKLGILLLVNGRGLPGAKAAKFTLLVPLLAESQFKIKLYIENFMKKRNK